jgi:hypothetical protein
VALVAKDFAATVDEWTMKAKGGVENVFKQSVQDVIEKMQTPGWSVGSTRAAINSGGKKKQTVVSGNSKGGNLPVDTGFLRSSLRVTLGSPASGLIDRPEGNDYTWAEERSYTMTIGGADITQSIYAVYLAKYARHVEYGTNSTPARGFRRLAVQQWPQIVAANIEKAKRMKPK